MTLTVYLVKNDNWYQRMTGQRYAVQWVGRRRSRAMGLPSG